MDDFDAKSKRAINDVKRGVRNLRKLGIRVEAVETENMMGEEVLNIYASDYISGRIVFRKHLFTINSSDWEVQNGL